MLQRAQGGGGGFWEEGRLDGGGRDLDNLRGMEVWGGQMGFPQLPTSHGDTGLP